MQRSCAFNEECFTQRPKRASAGQNNMDFANALGELSKYKVLLMSLGAFVPFAPALEPVPAEAPRLHAASP